MPLFTQSRNSLATKAKRIDIKILLRMKTLKIVRSEAYIGPSLGDAIA
jgi:hypothetical protein